MVQLKTIKKEQQALTLMAKNIEQVTKTNEQVDKLTDTTYWSTDLLYTGASTLAVKILLQKIGVKPTEQRIKIVAHELEDSNYHYPVEAVLNIDHDLTWAGRVELWKPAGESLQEHYLNRVREITSDLSSTAL